MIKFYLCYHAFSYGFMLVLFAVGSRRSILLAKSKNWSAVRWSFRRWANNVHSRLYLRIWSAQAARLSASFGIFSCRGKKSTRVSVALTEKVHFRPFLKGKGIASFYIISKWSCFVKSILKTQKYEQKFANPLTKERMCGKIYASKVKRRYCLGDISDAPCDSLRTNPCFLFEEQKKIDLQKGGNYGQ